MSHRPVNVLAVAALMLAAASTAAAQAAARPAAMPTYEASAGYQFLHLPDQNFPFGLNVDAARHAGALGLVADVGWARHSEDELGIDADTNMWNFGAGLRWTRFGTARAWPYAQVLAGAVVAHSSVEIAEVETSDTEASFMVQPGVGVTFVAGDGWGLFGQFDYRRTFFEEPDDVEDSINNQFRVFAGVRLILD